MSYLNRKRQILDLLTKNNGACDISYLSKNLYFSQSSLRRDIINMANEGLINRYHGGISLIEYNSLENSIFVRRIENKDKKIYISKLSKKFIKDGMVLFLDSSSTTWYTCECLKIFNDITVITNGINIAGTLNTIDNVRCFLCPGLLKHKSLSIVGEYCAPFLAQFKADLAIISCKSINKNGVFEGNDLQALVKRNMIKNADKVILLCDNTKEKEAGYFQLCGFDKIDVILSNAPFSDSLNELITKNNCQIIHK